MSFFDFFRKIANFLFSSNKENNTNTYQGIVTYTEKITEEIAGVKKGTPMNFEEAGKGVNPNYSHFGNINSRTNCQCCVAVFEARLRGYNVETCTPKDIDSIEMKSKLEQQPNIAFIEEKTGKSPDFTIIKPKNTQEFENILNSTVKKSERYMFAFEFINNTLYNSTGKKGHVVEVLKDENNILKIYDPQINKLYDISFLSNIKIIFEKFEEKIYPKILRVDNKNLNKKVLDKIAQSAKL